VRAAFATKNRKLAATLLVRDFAEASAGIFVASGDGLCRLEVAKTDARGRWRWPSRSCWA